MENPQNISCDTLNLLVEELGELQRSSQNESSLSWQASMWPKLRVQHKLDHDDVQIDGFRTVSTRRFSEVILGTYKLKNLVSLLGLLHGTAEDLLHKIEANVHRASNGIGRLLENIPDELLMRTMKLACQTHAHVEPLDFSFDMLSLSHINKRFRNLAIGMRGVWATVSTSAPLDLTDLCLGWSKSAGLHIDIAPSGFACPFLPYTEKVLPRTSQWKTLPFKWSPREDENPKIKSSCVGLDLPNLERFEYTLYRQRDDSIDHIYLTWRAPKLREISFRKVIPRVFPTSSITLVSMSFLDEPDDAYIPSLHGFHSFLQGTPTIEKLEIKCRLYASSTWSSSTFPKLKMDNLRSVDISCGYHARNLDEQQKSFDEHALCLLVQSIHGPYIERLKIFAHLELRYHAHEDSDNDNHQEVTEMDLSSLVFAFIPSPRAQSPVVHLDICIQGSRETLSCKKRLAVPLERFPALRDLSLFVEGVVVLEAPRVSSDDGSTPGAFSTLERLQLLKCWGGAKDFLRNIVEKTKEPSGTDRRSSLTVFVKCCPFVTEGELLRFIAKKDLVYEECLMTDALRARLEACGLLSRPADVTTS